ncbi:hypothetical protein, partial [Neisseria sp.]|uniref:hypothetical protein n=1 Tax=Neisseria sp. TaxID=192066 RepID=UPI0028A261FE
AKAKAIKACSGCKGLSESITALWRVNFASADGSSKNTVQACWRHTLNLRYWRFKQHACLKNFSGYKVFRQAWKAHKHFPITQGKQYENEKIINAAGRILFSVYCYRRPCLVAAGREAIGIGFG